MGLSWSIQVEAKCHYRKSSILVTVSNIKKSLRENGCVLLMVLGAVHHGGEDIEVGMALGCRGEAAYL